MLWPAPLLPALKRHSGKLQISAERGAGRALRLPAAAAAAAAAAALLAALKAAELTAERARLCAGREAESAESQALPRAATSRVA
jgi:hypothetical protein